MKTNTTNSPPEPRPRAPLHRLLTICLIIIAAQLACDQNTDHPKPSTLPLSEQGLPTAEITINGQTCTIELALNKAARTRGLMFRSQLPPNTGMLFVFDQPRVQTFYMKNCLIDLDILFIRADGIIARITTMKVPIPNAPLIHYPSVHPVKYVLELPAGTRKKLNLKPGQKIEIPQVIRNQPIEPE